MDGEQKFYLFIDRVNILCVFFVSVFLNNPYPFHNFELQKWNKKSKFTYLLSQYLLSHFSGLATVYNLLHILVEMYFSLPPLPSYI